MTSEYEDIMSRFLLKADSYQIISLDTNTVNEMRNGWIKMTLSRPYIRRLFSSITMDDDVEELEYEMKNPTTDEEDQDFVEEVIAQGCVIAWMAPMVQSELNIQQMFSGKELQFFSQSSHLGQIKDLYHSAQIELRKMIRDRGYITNTYLDGE